MHRRTRVMLLVVPCIALLPAAAPAQQNPDWQACNIPDPSGAAAKIAGCTRVLDRGGQSPRQTAIALANRALAHTWKNDADRAIADFSEAIRVDPEFPNWYYARAMQYEKKGQHQLAQTDLKEAVRLQPNTAEYVDALRRVQENSSIKAVFEKFGLLGIFASDCSKPADKDNVYFVTRVIDAAHVQRDEMSSPTARDHVSILDQASLSAPNELAVSGARDGQPSNGVWRIEGNRQISMEETLGGVKVISGGRYDNGRNVPWLSKCDVPAR